jgi:ABC-2 type transport system ATP-binding protein
VQVATFASADSSISADVVLRTVGLTKHFGPRLAVDHVDLEVRGGRVYGFLGPNGSGKTTTIGMIFGLVAPSAGHVELFGQDTREHLSATLPRVGAVLEGTSYLPHLSARDNLRVFGLLSGGVASSRIDAVLEMVALTSRANDKLRNYSLGMKQRLSVASALLHDPELLILDEPTNGLDPAGMREFRDMIRDLPRAGKTVFVSSHLLGEVEQMCDDVGILKAGRVLTQGPVTQLVASAGRAIELRVTDTDAALVVIQTLHWAGAVTRDGDRLSVDAPIERAADLSRALAEHGIYLRELRGRENSLEDVFLEITGEASDA